MMPDLVAKNRADVRALPSLGMNTMINHIIGVSAL